MSGTPTSTKENDRRVKAVKAAGGNLTQAAQALGLSRAGFYGWWRRYHAKELGVETVKTEKAARPSKPAKVEKAVSDEIKRLTAERDQAVEQLQATRAAKVDIIRPGKVRAKLKGDITRVIIPDSHGASIDPDAAAAFLADLKRLDPEQIVMLGDHLDCGGFLAAHHTLGFVAETSLTYAQDVKACNLFLDAIQAAAPRARIDYLAGNHECTRPDHEVLTSSGWKLIPDVTLEDEVATLTPARTVEWQRPEKLHCYDFSGHLKVFSSPAVKFALTPNHRLAFYSQYSGLLNYRTVSDFTEAGLAASAEVPVSASSDHHEHPVSDDQLSLVGWMMTDGGLNGKIGIYQSKPEGRDTIRGLLTRLGITFHESERVRDITEICGRTLKKAPLPCGFFEIRGDSRHEVLALLGIPGDYSYTARYTKSLPDWLGKVSDRQFKVFLAAVIQGDGSRASNATDLENGCACIYKDKAFLEALQALCVVHGYSATLASRSRSGIHSFWCLNVKPRGQQRVTAGKIVDEAYEGKVYCLTMPSGNFFTRLKGCVHVTGNCRVEKWCINETFKSGEDATFLLSVFGPEAVLNLKQRGIRYIHAGTRYDDLPVPGMIRHGKCHFTHGFACGKHAADTHMARAGTSIVFGHIHRSQSVISRTVHAGTVGAWSPGCLSKLQPFYMNTNPTDWSHGYAVQFVAPSEKFMHVQVPILEGESMLLGSLSGK